MRILHVITSLEIGGAEKLITDIVPKFILKGNTVDVCVFNGIDTSLKKTLLDAGVKVISLGYNCSVYKLEFIWKLHKLMKEYDIVHTHNGAPEYFGAVASLFTSTHIVCTEHNTTDRFREKKWFRPICTWMYKKYDKVICISDKAETNLKALMPSLCNVVTIYNGVDIKRFRQAKSHNELKPTDKILIIMVAAFRPQKDQDTLIKAFAQLPSNKYELWIVGDGERRSILERIVANYNLIESVKFLGIRHDIPELLNTADIIVMSSHYEGLSLSSVEGMSVGKPFIASDVDGLREVVNGYGILVRHEDPTELATEIMRLSENKKYYKTVADKCWDRAQMYDLQKMVDEYQQVYDKLMEK